MLCGIDEAGRGPLAGPLMIAGVVINKPIEGLADSKKLSEKKRLALFDLIIKSSDYHVVSFSALEIDKQGLSALIAQGLTEIMHKVKAQSYLFDGNSSFGVKGLETLIKADNTVDAVKAASILAKVTHDQEMYELDKLLPHYHFKSHKGYGTKAHIQAIKEHGYSVYHRKSYKVKALEGYKLT